MTPISSSVSRGKIDALQMAYKFNLESNEGPF